jgi:hypothetical protein
MISRSQFDRVAEHLLDVLSVTELLPPQDFEALETELADEVARRDLAIAINGLLHGKRSMEERFKHALGVFAHWGLARWPLLTVWPFLLHPDRYALIHWEVLLSLARQHGHEIDLPDTPDWPAFQTSQRLAHRVIRAHPGQTLLDLALR